MDQTWAKVSKKGSVKGWPGEIWTKKLLNAKLLGVFFCFDFWNPVRPPKTTMGWSANLMSSAKEPMLLGAQLKILKVGQRTTSLKKNTRETRQQQLVIKVCKPRGEDKNGVNCQASPEAGKLVGWKKTGFGLSNMTS